MAFIQQGAARRGSILAKRENVAFDPRREAPIGHRRRDAIQARGAWRIGGLAGALVYSVVCWTLVYHGARAVSAWTRPEPQIEASASPAPASEFARQEAAR